MQYSFLIIGYNEEVNARECIDSILALSGLCDYEVLFINDGSSDNTAEIVNQICATNPNVKLINIRQNKGRGYARHLGVKKAAGKYVIFVDADIRLPADWLEKCMEFMSTYDAVGGVAVPDGDVAYVHNRFGLKPRSVAHTTEITGSNCMFRAGVLEAHNYDPNLREGEDVDLSLRLRRAKIKMHTVPGLFVEHREHKTFSQSAKWLYECGLGATRQLFRFGVFRLPDYAFFGFLFFVALCAAEFALSGTAWSFLPLLLYPLLTSLLHLRSKFESEWEQVYVLFTAVLVNYVFIWAYYLGRIAGFLKVLTKQA